MDYETIAIIALMISPLYVLFTWRLKVGREVDIKLTKICTFIKLQFPEQARQIFT